ncbi:phage tail tape measure protein [Yinghuangia aomiensis]
MRSLTVEEFHAFIEYMTTSGRGLPLAFEDNELTVSISGDASDAENAFNGLADSAGRAQGDLDRTGGRADALKGPFLALGGVIAGAFATKALEGFSAALDHIGQQSKLQAQFGISPEDAKKASKEAGDLYAQGWGESFGAVQDSMSALARTLNLSVTDKALKPLTEKSLALAETFGAEVQDVARAAQSMVTSGVAPSIEAAFDLITKGFQGGLDKSGDFLDTMEEYSILFKGMGLDGQTAMGLISQGLKGGARNSDVMADALKEFGIRSKDMSATSVEAYKTLGLGAEDMSKRFAAGGTSARDAFGEVLGRIKTIKDPLQQSLVSIGLFGTKAEDLGSALFEMDLSSASGQFGDFAGAAEKMADTLENSPERKLESLKRTIEQKFSAALMGGAEKLADFGRGVRDAWNATDAESPGFLGALHKGLDYARDGVDFLRGPLDEVRGGVRAFFAAFKDGSDDVTSSGFAGFLESLGVQYRNIFDSLRAAADKFLTVFRNDLLPWFEQNLPKLEPLFGKVRDVVVVTLEAVKVAIDVFVAVATWAWTNFGDIILGHVTTVWDAFIRIIGGALDIVKGAFDLFIGIFTGDWSRAWSGIQAIFSGVADVLGGLFEAGLAKITLALDLFQRAFSVAWEAAWNALKGWFDEFFVEPFKTAFSGAVGWISEQWTNFETWCKELPGKMSGIFSGMFDGIKEAFKSSINWVINGWNSLKFSIPEFDTHIPGVGKIGGGSIGVPYIPPLANGGIILRGGTALVGERGPEFLDLPRGARVRPLDYGAGGYGLVVNVNVAGTVTAERDLAASIADRIREELERIERRNGRAR